MMVLGPKKCRDCGKWFPANFDWQVTCHECSSKLERGFLPPKEYTEDVTWLPWSKPLAPVELECFNCRRKYRIYPDFNGHIPEHKYCPYCEKLIKETANHAMDAMRYVYLGGRASGKSESIKEMFKQIILGDTDMGIEPKIRVKKLIFDYPATIVYWYDGTKTVVKCREGETFDKETGLAMAMCKKLLGEHYKSRFRNIIKGAIVKRTEPEKSNMEKLNDVLDHIIDDIDKNAAELHKEPSKDEVKEALVEAIDKRNEEIGEKMRNGTATTDEIVNLLENEDVKSGLSS